MVHRTTDTTIFPARMVQIRQFVQFRAHLLSRPSFFRQGKVARHLGTTGHKLRLETLECRGYLLVDLAFHAGDSKEDRVAVQSHGGVDVAEASEDAVTADGVERPAHVSEQKQHEDDIADAACLLVCVYVYMEKGGRPDRSRFNSWRVAAREPSLFCKAAGRAGEDIVTGI